MAAADTAARRREALDAWWQQVEPRLAGREDDLVRYVLDAKQLDDYRVRLLLTRATGADYGQRTADWQHWLATRAALDGGDELPDTPGPRITLKTGWRAPVGLTAWFSTLLPLDGNIYVPSLGTDFEIPDDAADGVVRVNGATGEASLWFSPPPTHRGPRDVVGISACPQGLFVGCRSGVVYCTDRSGRQRWGTHVGDPLVAPPMSVDLNHDGVTDVALATAGGNVVALSGHSGSTVWVARLVQPAPEISRIGARLALGSGTEITRLILATWPTGEVIGLNVRTGDVAWRDLLPAGVLAGAAWAGESTQHLQTAWIADRAAQMWALQPQAASTQLFWWGGTGIHRPETVIATPRLLGSGTQSDRVVIACPTGGAADGHSAVCALAPAGIHWRLPLKGAVWGSPAVADLNGDRVAEVIVAAIQATPDGQPAGMLNIVSSRGHLARQLRLESPIESSPLVSDVDGDGQLEILVADQSGWLHSVDTAGVGPVEWGLSAGDSHNTQNAANAYGYGQVPSGFQWEWTPE